MGGAATREDDVNEFLSRLAVLAIVVVLAALRGRLDVWNMDWSDL